VCISVIKLKPLPRLYEVLYLNLTVPETGVAS